MLDSGTTDAGDAAPTIDVGGKFLNEVYPIVRGSCLSSGLGCHEIATLPNHLTDFSTPESTYLRWVNGHGQDFCDPSSDLSVEKILVVPGFPEQSLLVEKITSTRTEMCRYGHQPRMPPPPQPPLRPEQVGVIVSWIRDGAASK